MTLPHSHWAYEAVASLSAAGWELPVAAARSAGRDLTRAEFIAIAGQLVAAAAAREQAGTATPMAQRIWVARLVAEFRPAVPATDTARVAGLHPEVVPSPDGMRLALFLPTPLGAEILIVDRAILKTIRLPIEGYNYGVAWSEDGDEVAWLRFAQGRTEVLVHSMLAGVEHLVGLFPVDGWGKLTPVKDGFTLSLPGQPDRAVRIPAHLEPENGGKNSDVPG